ncbi:MAG: hypothetical protein NVSMB46_09070 [Candidatus Saccharimonadales bacterium]
MNLKTNLEQQNRNIQILSVVAFVGLIIATVFLMKMSTYQLSLGHVTRNDLSNATVTQFAPAVHYFYDIDLRWIVVALLAVSIPYPLAIVLKKYKSYQTNIKKSIMPLRWLDFGVSSAIIVETIALLSGVHDVFTLKLIGGLMLVTCGLGWISDKNNQNNKKKTDHSTYFVSIITGNLPWLVIVSYALSTFVLGMVRYPWYVYALYASTLVSVIALSFNQWQHYSKRNQWSYIFIERNYLIINLLMKVSFGIIIIIGLKR